MKKAQTTFYIIFAVVISLAIGFYIIFNSMSSSDESKKIIQFEGASSLEAFTENCLKETAYTGIMRMGLQGGYIDIPGRYVPTIYTDVPYYYYHGEDLSPTLEVMENELARYIEDNVNYCLYNYRVFRDQGYVIETGYRIVEVSINEEDIFVELFHPVSVVKGVDRFDFEKFSFKTNIRLKEIFEITQDILIKVMIDPYNIDQTFLLSKMSEHELQIDTLTSLGGIVSYVIDDPKSVLWPGTQLMFIFATKTDMTERPPVIDMDDVYYANIGEKNLFSVIAFDPNDDQLEYYTNSTLVKVNQYSGVISFTPKEQDIGEHIVEITVSDGKYSSNKNIKVIVGDLQ